MDSRTSSRPQQGRSVTVGELMRPAVTAVERHAHLAAAAYLMRHASDTAVVVTTDDESRRPIGIVTQTDVIAAVAEGKDLDKTRIEELTGRDPVTEQPATAVDQAAEVMLSAGVRHLPVVDDGRLVGIFDVTTRVGPCWAPPRFS
jgi:CBS domain-containing protein